MTELREKIVETIWENCVGAVIGADQIADAVLAIPEIKEALALKAHCDTKVGYERQG